jgi:hypothetical protein
MEVRVTVPGSLPYVASCRIAMYPDQTKRFPPGAVLRVRVDPRKPMNFVFELDANSDPAPWA